MSNETPTTPMLRPFDVARNIVNQLADQWQVPVDVRQATNDTSWEFAEKLIREHVATQQVSRPALVEALRWLAHARRQYCHNCPQSQNDMHEMHPLELAVHEEHATAAWLADIIEGSNTACGWLPSWLWPEWAEISGRLGNATCGHQLVPYEDGSSPCVVGAGVPHARHIDVDGKYWTNEEHR